MKQSRLTRTWNMFTKLRSQWCLGITCCVLDAKIGPKFLDESHPCSSAKKTCRGLHLYIWKSWTNILILLHSRYGCHGSLHHPGSGIGVYPLVGLPWAGRCREVGSYRMPKVMDFTRENMGNWWFIPENVGKLMMNALENQGKLMIRNNVWSIPFYNCLYPI